MLQFHGGKNELGWSFDFERVQSFASFRDEKFEEETEEIVQFVDVLVEEMDLLLALLPLPSAHLEIIRSVAPQQSATTMKIRLVKLVRWKQIDAKRSFFGENLSLPDSLNKQQEKTRIVLHIIDPFVSREMSFEQNIFILNVASSWTIADLRPFLAKMLHFLFIRLVIPIQVKVSTFDVLRLKSVDEAALAPTSWNDHQSAASHLVSFISI